MEYADEAELSRLRGDFDRALVCFKQAFDAERQAAEFFRDRFDSEPNRSVLYRSAASLAMDCGEMGEAERLIATGLAGYPPNEIADELRDLLEQVYFQRHLDLRGLTLQKNELQLSIAGPAVGFGMARSEEFVTRVHQVETLLFRTAERHRGRRYREAGGPTRSIRREYEVYMSAPRAASFAVSLRLGGPKDQMDLLPDTEEGTGIVTDLLECLTLFNAGDQEGLRERIPEAPYFRNFVGLAKQLAPDGEDVRVVGITASAAGRAEQRVALTRPRDEIPHLEPSGEGEKPVEVRTVTGVLRFADALRSEQRIKLVDDKGKPHNILVPEGMMTDIVKPLWNDRVVVTGRVQKRALLLDDIQVADAPAEQVS
jgi:hypothetical protein